MLKVSRLLNNTNQSFKRHKIIQRLKISHGMILQFQQLLKGVQRTLPFRFLKNIYKLNKVVPVILLKSTGF